MKNVDGQTGIRMEPEQSSSTESRSVVDETDIFTPSPPSVDNHPEKAGHLNLSEFRRADIKSFPRAMLLSSYSPEDYFPENPSLNLEKKLLSVVDCSSDRSPVSHNKCVEIKHDAQPASAALVQQSDSLDQQIMESESSLISFVCNDNAEGLVNSVQKMAQILKVDEKDEVPKARHFEWILDYCFPHRLLHLACQLDSVACAKALLEGETGLASPVNAVDEWGKTALHHAAGKLSVRCIELLLRKRAKTELRSNDGCTPLKAALENKRWQTDWQMLPAIEIIRILRTQDLTAVKLLAGHTKDALRLACHLAFDGNATALTALILAAGKSLLGNEHRYESLLDVIVEKVLSSGREDLTDEKLSKVLISTCDERKREDHRSSILKSLEIIVHLKGELEGSPQNLLQETQRKKPSALLRSVQAGDEIVIKILLNDVANINVTDSDGNTALHWCLRTSLATKGLRIVWLLVTHGSTVDARNRLGLTPVHIAAGQGHLQALQLLLAQDPDAVHVAAETRETPLFLAVKNNHVECAKLLLQFGSNSQALNLRRQRPIDFANSQDMRALLSQNGKYTTGKRCSYVWKAPECTDFNFPTSTLDISQSKAVYALQNLEDVAKINKFIQPQDEVDEDSKYWLQRTQHAKTALCRYHKLPGGCARGDHCFYAHGEQELRPLAQAKATVTDALNDRKIFVGGLLPTVGSDDLKECLEAEFGPIAEATVMGSQTGGRIQSRGFGFVTFKNKASYDVAVRQHYVILFGKRVEIKPAVQSSTRTDEEMLQMHWSNPLGQMFDEQETYEAVQWSSMIPGDTTASSSPVNCSPLWLTVFKKWLPAFLCEVSKRQRGGECYPLSSVKADFRATCGMELDHAALGYPKLSDFLRTMPELCRMKIVPVGRGPATHVVLQVRRQIPVSKTHQPTHAARILSSSLVHEGRTYAAAVEQNIATPSEIKSAQQSPDSESSKLIKTLPLTGRNSDQDDNEEKSFRKLVSKMPDQIYMAASTTYGPRTDTYNAQQQAMMNLEKLSLFSTLDTEKKPTLDTEKKQQIHPETMFPTVDAITAAWQQGLAGNNLAPQSFQEQFMRAPITNAKFQSVIPEPPATHPLLHHRSALPFPNLHENPLMEEKKPFPALKGKPMPSFLLDVGPFYNPWNSNTFQGCKNLIQQMNLATDMGTGEESPQSTLTSEDPIESPAQSIQSSTCTCIICGDKAAIWVALPCAHKAMCSPCKDRLQKRNQSLQQCFICHERAREWIAQYY